MSKVVLDREVSSPIDRVFAYHTDLTRAPEYWGSLKECRPLAGQPTEPAVGARYRWRYTMVGRDIEGEFTVRELVPLQRFVFEVSGGVRGMFTHEYRATARTRTYVVVKVDYEVPLGLLGKAVDRLFVEQRNVADGSAALDVMQERVEREYRAAAASAPAAVGEGHRCRPPHGDGGPGALWSCPDARCERMWEVAVDDDVAYWRPRSEIAA